MCEHTWEHTKGYLRMIVTDACHSDFFDAMCHKCPISGIARVKLIVSTTMPKQFIEVVGATSFFIEISKPMSLRRRCKASKKSINLAQNINTKDIINIVHDVVIF